jgi:hypothetical protein
MGKKLDPEELVMFRSALLSEIIASEALVNLLERKGIITKKELLEEINAVHESLSKVET